MDKRYAVYTDGSFIRGYNVCGYGVVFVSEHCPVFAIYGATTDPAFVEQWNVGGEIEAVIRALEYAMSNDIKELDIYHDYIGLSKWPLKEWKAKTSVTKMYREIVWFAMSSGVRIRWHKVRGHSGNTFNDLADRFANKGRALGETSEEIYYFTRNGEMNHETK